MVVGEMHAVVRGEVNALVSLGKMTTISADMEAEIPDEMKMLRDNGEVDTEEDNTEDVVSVSEEDEKGGTGNV